MSSNSKQKQQRDANHLKAVAKIQAEQLDQSEEEAEADSLIEGAGETLLNMAEEPIKIGRLVTPVG